MSRTSSCVVRNGYCQSYANGHNMHFIHARHVGETPWGWRDGVVDALLPYGWVQIVYVDQPAVVKVWHHQPLRGLVRRGDPVRLNENWWALGGPFGWVNVLVRGGLGKVPDPVAPEIWASEITGGVVDLSTGRGLALDHLDED
jgi:hypothetical protein